MPRLAKLEGPKDLRYNKVRQAYLQDRDEKDEAKRLRDNAKCRESSAVRRAEEKQAIAEGREPRKMSRKAETPGRYYSKDPEPTSTDMKQYGVWRGDDTFLEGTVPTGEPAPLRDKPLPMRDGCGNDIADKWRRPIKY